MESSARKYATRRCAVADRELLNSRDYFFFFSWYRDLRDLHSFLHDALPIYAQAAGRGGGRLHSRRRPRDQVRDRAGRSEEHTSELQSRVDIVCRLLFEKKKPKMNPCAPIGLTTNDAFGC